MRVVKKPEGFVLRESRALNHEVARRRCVRRLYLLYSINFSILLVEANRRIDRVRAGVDLRLSEVCYLQYCCRQCR